MSLAAPSSPPAPSVVLIPEAEIGPRLRALVDEHGLTGTARLLRMTREPIARELAGIATRNGTRALLRERLSAL